MTNLNYIIHGLKFLNGDNFFNEYSGRGGGGGKSYFMAWGNCNSACKNVFGGINEKAKYF